MAGRIEVAGLQRVRMILLLLAAPMIAFVGACKEGDRLVGDTLLAVPSFEAETPDVASHYVALRGGGVSGSRVLLEVTVAEVQEPISGIAMKIRYPSDIARFVSCSDGNLLPATGSCLASMSAADPGTLFVGRSIQAPQAPVPVEGTKVAVGMEFVVFARGSGSVVFEAENLGGSDASAVLDAAGEPIPLRWFGGRLVGK